MLVIVPRHPERFETTTQSFRKQGFNTQLRSQAGLCDIHGDVFVVDTMGELLEFYASSDIAFVGGSIANIGGHNVLEAAVFSLPVLVGPNTHNFDEITELLEQCGGSYTVHDSLDIIQYMDALIEDKALRQKMGQAGKKLVQKHRGAVHLTMDLIESFMNEKPLYDAIKSKHYPRIVRND
jgi:3-deoxy-D-manno-octulosonic-acid transferase